MALAARGARVGAVDADLNGPSLGKMLGLLGSQLEDRPDGIVPAVGVAGVKGISTDLLIEEGVPLRWKGPAHDQFVWQGVTEAVALREFISDVVWGPIDYLIIDIPPGTDKIGRFLDLVSEVGPSHLQPDQVLLVTIPSEVAGAVVARSATQLLEGGVPCIGLIGNMAGYAQPGRDELLPLFTGPSAGDIADAVGLELWSEIPFDPVFGSRTDNGDPAGAEGDSIVAQVFTDLAERVEHGPGGREEKK
ncbi:MAG: iron-sulfur cluster carrier protein [Gammaproteobacteria bacterium]|nr:MAG: iron-sulfur cluster carrier protein [Gammaproteobacteria bacterium]GIT50116.1 MAG: iron-sulfur cluster carrier protein [Gemmatimonadota bacterium]